MREEHVCVRDESDEAEMILFHNALVAAHDLVKVLDNSIPVQPLQLHNSMSSFKLLVAPSTLFYNESTCAIL